MAVVCLHGAGDAALVWDPVAKILMSDKRLEGTCVVAADLRGHGTVASSDTEMAELTIPELVGDAVDVICAVSRRLGSDTGIALAGHSLGGAIAARAAAECLRKQPPLPIRATLLLDAVEGTAIDTFARASAWLRSRPKSFVSLDAAVRWALVSGMLQSEAVARLTVPARLKQVSVEQCQGRSGAAAMQWEWRARIAEAEHHWKGWFEGLSDIFTRLPLPKLLVVGGVDRLDSALEAAHMQGRFRLAVVPHTGHQLHEDRPEEVADAFASFLVALQRQQAAFSRLQADAKAASLKRSHEDSPRPPVINDI